MCRYNSDVRVCCLRHCYFSTYNILVRILCSISSGPYLSNSLHKIDYCPSLINFFSVILVTKWEKYFFLAILTTMVPSKNKLAQYWSVRFYLGVLHCCTGKLRQGPLDTGNESSRPVILWRYFLFPLYTFLVKCPKIWVLYFSFKRQ